MLEYLLCIVHCDVCWRSRREVRYHPSSVGLLTVELGKPDHMTAVGEQFRNAAEQVLWGACPVVRGARAGAVAGVARTSSGPGGAHC